MVVEVGLGWVDSIKVVVDSWMILAVVESGANRVVVVSVVDLSGGVVVEVESIILEEEEVLFSS